MCFPKFFSEPGKARAQTGNQVVLSPNFVAEERVVRNASASGILDSVTTWDLVRNKGPWVDRHRLSWFSPNAPKFALVT